MKKIILFSIVMIAQSAVALALDYSELSAKWEAGWYEQIGADVADAAAQKNPDHRALYYKARALLFTKQLEEAQKWAEKAVKAAPDSASYWAQLGAAKAFRIREKPLRGITLGRSCKKDFEKAVQIDPTHLESLWALMRFHMHAPGIVGGNKDKAWELAEAIMALNPAQGHQARGQLYLQLDKSMDQALAENRAAVAVDPANFKICYEIASSLLNGGHSEEALEFFRLGAQCDPDVAAGLVKLAGVHLRLGDLDQARLNYRKALAADPEEISASLGEGEILLATGQYDAAEAHFRAVLADHPDYLPTRYYLAKALNEADRSHEEAAELLNSYLASHLNFFWPSRAKATWQLALAQEKLGDYDGAYESIVLAQDLSWGSDQMNRDADRLEFMAKD